jgi:hypothetical protein
MAIYFAKYGTGGRKDYQHRVPPEWLSYALVCDDCGTEYDAELDECPDCGSLDAELVETGCGPGRFWGYRGLTPVLAARQVTPDNGIAAGRVLRRWYHAKGLTQTRGRVRSRRMRKRRRLFGNGRGFACVNDGPASASQLARYLNAITGHFSTHHPTATASQGDEWADHLPLRPPPRPSSQARRDGRDRVGGGVAPPPPTPPDMRARIRRFVKPSV